MPRANSQSRLRTACIISSACLGALATANPAPANTPATWLAPVSGNWTDATKWSTDPYFPETNTPASADASISATGAPYNVSFSSNNIDCGAITLDSADATLSIDSGILHPIDGLAIDNGNLLLNGGTLQEALFSGGGGNFIIKSGTLNAPTFDRDAIVVAPSPGQLLPIARSVSIQGATLNLSSGSVLVTGSISGGSVVSAGDGYLLAAENGLGRIHYSGVSLDTDVYVGADSDFSLENGTILKAGRKIHMGGDQNDAQVPSTFAGEILFEGSSTIMPSAGSSTIGSGMVIRTAGGDGFIRTQPGGATLTNAGLVSVETAGNQIDVSGPGVAFTNSGTLQVSAGMLNVSSQLQNTGTVNVIGGTCQFSNSWDNSSGTINLSAGQINLGGPGFDLSKIGTFNRTGGLVFLTGTFKNTSGTTADLTAAVGSWRIGNGAKITGGVIVQSSPTQALTVPSNAGLTIDSADIETPIFLEPSSTLSLSGAWRATTWPIYINSAVVAAGGNINASNLGNLDFQKAGTLCITGNFDNAGETLVLNDRHGWQLGGGTISGGTLASQDGGVLDVVGYTEPYVPPSVSTFDAVTLASTVSIHAGSRLNITGGIAGAGTFVFSSPPVPQGAPSSDPSPAWQVSPGSIVPANGPLVIPQGISIQTGDGSGYIGNAGTVIDNQGFISARSAGQLIILRGDFTNEGTIEAASGGTIQQQQGTYTHNAGTIHIYTNGSYIGAGDLVLNGGTIQVDAGGEFVSQGKTTLQGGAIGGEGVVHIAPYGDSDAGLTVAGTTSKFGNGALDIAGHGLTVLPGARLDLTRGELILRAASPHFGTWNGSAYTDLTGMVQSGRNGGTWDGPGIMTSATSDHDQMEVGIATGSQLFGIGDIQSAMWMGHTISGYDVLVMYTYGGDANLDGKINIDDYGRIDASVGRSGSVFGWYNGDFNYDGKINIDDYGIIDSNIGSQGAPLGIASDLAGIAQDGITAVPEPSAILLLILPLLVLPARRRRRFFKI